MPLYLAILLAGALVAIGIVIAVLHPKIPVFAVPNALGVLKKFSLQAMGLAAALQGWWMPLTDAQKASYPPHIVSAITIVLMIYGIAASFIQQPLTKPAKAAQLASGDPNKPGGQAGFSALVLMIAIAASCIVLSGCATTGLPEPKNAEQASIYAESTATAADALADQLLRSHTITSADAVIVLNAARAVHSASVTARAFAGKGDETNAAAQISAVQSDIETLLNFMQSHK